MRKPALALAAAALLTGCGVYGYGGTGEPIRTGMSASEVRTRLGPPAIACGGVETVVLEGQRVEVWNYACSDGVPLVRVFFRNGKVQGWQH